MKIEQIMGGIAALLWAFSCQADDNRNVARESGPASGQSKGTLDNSDQNPNRIPLAGSNETQFSGSPRFVPPPPPGPSAAELAAQKALEEKVASANAAAVSILQEKANAADGSLSSSLLAAKEVNDEGANHAATMGALFCAQAANNQAASDNELAGQNYGACKQYFDVASGLRVAAGAPYKVDATTMGSTIAQGALEQFEKNFGVSGSEFLGRMLGAGASAENAKTALQDMTSGKLDGDALGKSFENGTASEGANFELKFAAAPQKARSAPRVSLASALRKSLAEESDRAGEVEESYRRLAAHGSSKGSKNGKLADLEPLREGIFAEKDAAASNAEPPAVELSLFDVVHSRYLEVIKRKALY